MIAHKQRGLRECNYKKIKLKYSHYIEEVSMKIFYPDYYYPSTYSIPFEKMYAQGIRGVLFDVDNTLVPHGAPADERAKQLFIDLKAMGMSYCLISNNKEKRVASFNKEIKAPYIFDAHKPSTKNYKKAMEIMGTSTENTAFVGDQLFTDVWGAKRTGMLSILVKPMDPKEEIQIVLKRYIEKVVLYSYKKSKKYTRIK